MSQNIVNIVDFLANIASIATGVVAVFVWIRLKGDDAKRMRRLEDYLKNARSGGRVFQHSAVHLSGRLGMTEAQVFQAAVASENIENVIGQDEHGFANRILFQYVTGR